MEGQNQGRMVLAATLLTAALLFAAMRAVESAPFADWWLPILLFVAAIAVLLLDRFGWRLNTPAPDFETETESLPPLAVGATRTYRVSEAAPLTATATAVSAGAQGIVPPAPPPGVETPASAPINTMFIRPERAADANVASGADEEPSAEHPIPDAQEAVPAAVEVDLTPPDTKVDEAAVEAKPNQGMPLEKGTEPGEPAATPGFTARTEHANPEAAATQEQPAEPPPATAEVETPHDDPVKESVVEKTAAPQQPYEQANMGQVTPAEVDRVLNDQPSETAAKITETASPEITASETGVPVAVGSADDLEIIDGIGPKIAAALRAAGIDSFQKLANATESQLKEILSGANVRYPGTTLPYWAHQAAYAARQDWDGFKKYNAERKSSGADD